MRKTILTIQILLLGFTLIFAQETQTIKRFNYGVDAFALFDFAATGKSINTTTSEFKLKPISYVQYGMNLNIYYNFNEKLFLQTGVGNVMCKWKEETLYFPPNNSDSSLYAKTYIAKYFYLDIPLSVGYNITKLSDNTILNCAFGAKISFINTYYYYLGVEEYNGSIVGNETKNSFKDFFKGLGYSSFPVFFSIGVERDYFPKNISAGLSLLFQTRTLNAVIPVDKNYQIGLVFNIKF
ncbi:MAG: hypothetical protein PHW82_11975 [Bacteroidales bacterium]|nr:hypothetical protein [Bacteroidales bacterium]